MKQLRLLVAVLGLLAALAYMMYLFGIWTLPLIPWISAGVLIGSYLIGLYLQRWDR